MNLNQFFYYFLQIPKVLSGQLDKYKFSPETMHPDMPYTAFLFTRIFLTEYFKIFLFGL